MTDWLAGAKLKADEADAGDLVAELERARRDAAEDDELVRSIASLAREPVAVRLTVASDIVAGAYGPTSRAIALLVVRSCARELAEEVEGHVAAGRLPPKARGTAA